jgi:hypothetical protein
MPVYLLHGFRWPRPLIRIHIILQNLDDAAAEWLVAPGTTKTLLKNFNRLYPESMDHLKELRFVEQYDPEELDVSSQPYAYVADICQEIKLGLDIDDFRGKGVASDQWQAMLELRDRIAPEERVGWYVVVCGDEERYAPPTISLLNKNGILSGGSETDSTHTSRKHSIGVSQIVRAGNTSTNSLQLQKEKAPKDEEPRGFRKFFARRKR